MHLQDALWLYLTIGVLSCSGFWWWSQDPPIQRLTQAGLNVVFWPMMWPLLWDLYQKYLMRTRPRSHFEAPQKRKALGPQSDEMQKLLWELDEAFAHAPTLGQLHTTLESSQPIRQGLEELLSRDAELNALLTQERFSLERAQARIEQAQNQQDPVLIEHAQSGLLHIQQLHGLQKQLKQRLHAIFWQLERLITQLALLRFTQTDANEAQEALIHLLDLLESWNETSQPPSP